MQIQVAHEVPATMRFDRETLYTFRMGPNAGRAVRYLGPGKHPYEDMVEVVTVDGRPFKSPFGAQRGFTTAFCRPPDLVQK